VANTYGTGELTLRRSDLIAVAEFVHRGVQLAKRRLCRKT
jgi:hypothetical protein